MVSLLQFDIRSSTDSARMNVGLQCGCIRIEFDSRRKPPEIWRLANALWVNCQALFTRKVRLAERHPEAPNKWLVPPDDGNLKAATHKEICIVDDAIIRVQEIPCAFFFSDRIPSPRSVVGIAGWHPFV